MRTHKAPASGTSSDSAGTIDASSSWCRLMLVSLAAAAVTLFEGIGIYSQRAPVNNPLTPACLLNSHATSKCHSACGDNPNATVAREAAFHLTDTTKCRQECTIDKMYEVSVFDQHHTCCVGQQRAHRSRPIMGEDGA